MPLTATEDTELMQIFASTEPNTPAKTESKALVKAPANVAAATQTQTLVSNVLSKPKGIFVQHGSFARLQGALVWQSNYSNERKTKVFIKGTNPKRLSWSVVLLRIGNVLETRSTRAPMRF